MKAFFLESKHRIELKLYMNSHYLVPYKVIIFTNIDGLVWFYGV
jgi:hypothetical protein